MQDLRTGEMVPLDVKKFLDALPAVNPSDFLNATGSHQKELERLSSAMQAAKDAALPREFQGAVFQEGEIIEIRGSKFKVDRISPKRLILRGIPKL